MLPFTDIHILNLGQGYHSSLTHLMMQMVPTIKHLAFLNWMDYLVVKEPKETNSKWCDLSNSQKHHDFSRKSYFCGWSFQKKIFIYLRSQFSHANVLPDVIERVQLWNCLIFFHHWHFNILLFLSNLLFSSTQLMQINKHWIQTKFLKLLT